MIQPPPPPPPGEQGTPPRSKKVQTHKTHVTTQGRPDMMYTIGLLALAYARPTPILLHAARPAAHYLYRSRRLALRLHLARRAVGPEGHAQLGRVEA